MISLERVKQRKIFQWAAAYLAAAWVVLQVLGLLAQPFNWPPLVLRGATVVLAAGFLMVLVLAWYHGEQGRQRIGGTELLMLAAVLLLAGASLWWVRPDPVAPAAAAKASDSELPEIVEENSIAVLPLTDLSPGNDQEYFSDGITEELLHALTRVNALRVAARTSSFSFKGRNTPVDEIGRRLRVAHVLEGSVRKDGSRVRITVQLISTANGYHLWSEVFDRELKDIFAVQEEISQAIVSRLLKTAASSSLVSAATSNEDAYELYLKGRHLWISRTPEGLNQAVQLFERAIAIDSAFARAYVGLADALIVLPIYTNVRPSEAQPRAKAAALKALTLDPELSEAYATLAYVHMSYDRDWPGADTLFRKALRLNPKYPTLNGWYGDYLGAQGQVDESIKYFARAASYDTLAPMPKVSHAWLLMAQKRFDESIALFRKAIELDSTLVDARTHMARAMLFAGRKTEAIDSLERAVTRSDRRAMELGFLGHAYAQVGRSADAQRILRELNTRAANSYVTPLASAFIYIGLADFDHAFEALENARLANDPWFTENGFDLIFDPLRSDTRWAQLRKRMGLTR